MAVLLAACGSNSNDNATGSSSSASTSGSSTAAAAKFPPGPIKIGVALSQTGSQSGYDLPGFGALKLTVEQLNAQGGINGHQIELITADTKSDPIQAKAAAEDVISKGAVMLVAPCDYDHGAPAAAVAQAKGLISWSFCSASLKWGTQGIGPYAYTAQNPAVSEGYVMAEFAKQKNMNNVAMLQDTSISFDKESCGGFKVRLTELGGTVTTENFTQGDPSIASQITAIQRAKPDAIYMCSYTPGGASAIRQIRAAGIDVPILANTGMDGEYWFKSVPGLSNFYFNSALSVYGGDPTENAKKWIADYKKSQGALPAGGFAAVGSAVLELWAEAVKRAGTTASAPVAAQLDKFKDVPSVMGPTTFTPEIHITMGRPQAISEVTNGKTKFLDYVVPKKVPPFQLPN
jgi:branched-chain amino acid transport system substrate-binding protein